MDIFDYWRLNEDFLLSEVAMLMLGVNPQELEKLERYCRNLEKIEAFRRDVDVYDQDEYDFDEDELSKKPDFDQDPEEWKDKYDVLVKTLSKAVSQGRLKAEIKMITGSHWDTIAEEYYEVDTDEVNVEKTIVHIEELREWLKSRGVRSGFFFQTSEIDAIPEYLNAKHKHYAPKLAAAVNAWLEVSRNPGLRKNKNPKQAIDIWLRKNADRYGLTKDDGNPNEQGITEISKVANWKLSGVSKMED